jgi:PAS domain S-box-containing protein
MPATVATSARIPWHRRIEAVVVLSSSLIVGSSLGAVLVATTRLVTNRSLDRASLDLETARVTFYRLIANQAASAAAQARLITALPVFRAHMTDSRLASDAATIFAMADEYRQQLGAEFCIVTNRDGSWIGSPGWPGQDRRSTIQPLVTSAIEGASRHDLLSIEGRLFLVVSEPARFAEETLGTFTVGYALDDRFASELAASTHAEVTLVAGQRISGSSAPAAVRTALEAALGSGESLAPAPGAAVTIRKLGDGAYAGGSSSLFPDHDSSGLGALVLLQDWRPTQQLLDDLRRRLALVWAATFGLAVAGGVIFSRRLSRPLKDISDAAGDIASGNWDRQVPVRGRAEVATMATAFNEMTTTVRHWHEEARDRSERLQTSYERFRAVTESVRDGIVSIDRHGSIVFWNRSAARLFECDEQETLGTAFIDFIDPPDRRTYLDAAAFAAGGAASPTIEITGVGKTGSRVPIELVLSPAGSEQSAVTAIVRDITDRREAEAVLRQRNEELRQAQKMEAIGRLAGGVAHDFNNLLTAIQGFAELLRESGTTPDEEAEYIDEILKAAGRAAQLTRQLLAFSRRQVLAPRVLALDQILSGTDKLLRRLIGEDVDLVCESEAALARVKADPGQIEQVLVNLAINARDAMPNGGTLRISLATVELDERAASLSKGLTEGRYVRLDVVDNGTGMSAETLSKVFEPFFTTKPEGQGTGLGLAMVYGIVRQSGGSVEVESQPGKGTRFRILLPRCDDVEGARVEESPSRRQSNRGSEILLLVEDDDMVRGLVGTTLRRYGYTVIEAAGALAALEASRSTQGPIHLLLTDVVMPHMNGRRLAELIRTERADTRILFMSGYSDDAILRAGVQTHQMPFIQKPFSAETLAAKIRETLA